MSDKGAYAAAILSSGFLQRHLLPRLSIFDLLRLQCVSTALQDVVCSASDSSWRAATARTTSRHHYLTRVQTGCQLAAREYANLQRAIRTQEPNIACACAASVAELRR